MVGQAERKERRTAERKKRKEGKRELMVERNARRGEGERHVEERFNCPQNLIVPEPEPGFNSPACQCLKLGENLGFNFV